MLEARRKNSIFFGLLIMLPLVAFSLYRWYERNKQPLPVYGGVGKNKLGKDVEHVILSFSFINQQNKKAKTCKKGNLLSRKFVENRACFCFKWEYGGRAAVKFLVN